MNRMKLIALAAAGLAVLGLLALFFAVRYGVRPDSNPVSRPEPFEGAMPEIKIEKKRSPPVRIVNPEKKAEGPKQEKKRKKRVSTLADPGEAIVGGVSADTGTAATVLPVEKK